MTDILSRLRDAHLLSRMELVALAGEAHGELVRLHKQLEAADFTEMRLLAEQAELRELTRKAYLDAERAETELARLQGALP